MGIGLAGRWGLRQKRGFAVCLLTLELVKSGCTRTLLPCPTRCLLAAKLRQTSHFSSWRAGRGVRVLDTGVHLYFGGACYYRQIDALAMSLCVAKVLRDDAWDEYVVSGYEITKKYGMPPKVSIAMFTDAFPSAYQRGKLATHLKKHGIPPLQRVAVLTDNALIRGAMTAFGWIMPRTTLRAFEVLDVARCLDWLQEGGGFDSKKAAAAWTEARRMLGVDAPPGA